MRVRGEQTFVNVTFPEGYTVGQVASRLAEKVPRLDAATFLQQAGSGVVVSDFGPVTPSTGPTALEGLLFPDTYQISGDDSATRVIDRMVSLMERVGRQEGLDKSEEKVGYSPYEVLVIASMIGAPGLGREVLSALQRADVGTGFVAGLGIVILAIIIDRFTQSFSLKKGTNI